MKLHTIVIDAKEVLCYNGVRDSGTSGLRANSGDYFSFGCRCFLFIQYLTPSSIQGGGFIFGHRRISRWAGPSMQRPWRSKREPWQGQSHVFSSRFQCRRQPRCGQRKDTTCNRRSSERYAPRHHPTSFPVPVGTDRRERTLLGNA